jgi:hypothetical protein
MSIFCVDAVPLHTFGCGFRVDANPIAMLGVVKPHHTRTSSLHQPSLLYVNYTMPTRVTTIVTSLSGHHQDTNCWFTDSPFHGLF